MAVSNLPASRLGTHTQLTGLRRGESGTVIGLELGTTDAAQLRALGISPGVRIRLCRSGEPCIVALLYRFRTSSADPNADSCCAGVNETCCSADPDLPASECRMSGCRIGLARRLAERVTVQVEKDA